MLFRKMTTIKQALLREIFMPFCSVAASGPAWELTDLLYQRYVVENNEYGDDGHYYAVMNYFRDKVLPHKLAVYKAGQELAQLPGFIEFVREPREYWYDCLWQHDLSKFSSNEALGYAFYNFQTKEGKEGFELAWNHHKQHNPHHPEHWFTVNRDGTTELHQMPRIFVAEMVADWIGAGNTYGKKLEDWLPENLPTFRLHQKSMLDLRDVLSILDIKVEQRENALYVMPRLSVEEQLG